MGRKRAEVEAGPNDMTYEPDDGYGLSDITHYNHLSFRARQNKDGRLLIPHGFEGDSLVAKSNCHSFAKEYPSGEHKWWNHLVGSFGGGGLIIDMKAVPDNVSEDVAEFLNALNDYPVADDTLHSEMESEAQDEAWSNWARRDFISELSSSFGDDDLNEAVHAVYPNCEDLREALDEQGDHDLGEFFREAAEKANEYWSEQSGGDMWIDIDRIVKKISLRDLKEFLNVK
jgi:hypothetical protein